MAMGLLSRFAKPSMATDPQDMRNTISGWKRFREEPDTPLRSVSGSDNVIKNMKENYLLPGMYLFSAFRNCDGNCDLMVLIVIVSTMNRPLSLNCLLAYNLSEILL